MDKLEVGMYVRTKIGMIAKCTCILEDCSYDFDENIYKDDFEDNVSFMEIPYHLIDKYIKKASSNIIDLIETGDYVNGFKIDDITEKDKDHPERIAWHLTYYGDDDIPFRNNEIKSIVTKEQFEAMKYEVE